MMASVVGTDEPQVLEPRVLMEGEEPRAKEPDRRALRRARRRARRSRHLYALSGLAVLAAFLVATIIVVDVVR
ncbi:MAG: hypothetical protein ACRDXC_11965 [Acidimicrobiales bacterium]